ncbi:response regulator transcription factor [Salipaludibacillus sp. CUR1]|uniref:response regulator transcription factor n=1 Tax=Salipaludibacillus sp. CUR1 TaxID=2820003 RepID=UPI001E2A688B|nr:response regulator transcription factor [Salipaludibacillus sp. CUR1]MCE7791340.1 response regulator transcription factor [Salipaludibacillus sp. CUR1]
MAGDKILIVEDDADIRELTSLYLKKKGFEVITAENGAAALKLAETADPQLILLDVLLPGMEGFDICREIRNKTDTPIIFLSCKRSSSDKIKGLNAGGDDYITKPFDLAELEARIRANLRRNGPLSSGEEKKSRYLMWGEVKVDLNSFDVFVKEERVSLYAKELQLLLFLMKHPNQVFSSEQLYNHIWGFDQYGDLKTVSVHIRNLRKKIEENPAKPEYIQTVRGFGYKFNNKA